MLKLSATLKLPVEAVTGTFAVTGMRGTGKTSTAVVMAEEMVDAGAQIVVIDPTDVWFGLASSADGKHPGRDVYVFGNMRSGHADLQLEPGSGVLIADAIVDENINAVVSLRHLTASQQREWVRVFAERLYNRKGEPEHRTSLHLFVDEVKEFTPQRGSTVCAEALTRIVTLGRSSGIGCTLITQRPALVNKDVWSQCETLVAMRTSYQADRKALDEWIESHDPGDRRREFMGSIASVPVGTAWVWSPGEWDLFQRVAVRPRTTFDSSSTPKAGQRPLVPRSRSTVDLSALGAKMAATIARSEENDPVKLRQRVAVLEHDLAAASAATETETVTVTEEVLVPVQVVDRELLAALRDMMAERIATGQADLALMADVQARLGEAALVYNGLSDYQQYLLDFAAYRAAMKADQTGPPPRPAATPPARAPQPAATSDTPSGDVDPRYAQGSGGPARMLRALAANPGGLTRSQLGTQAKLSKKGGTFGTYISRLKSSGFITEDSNRVYATPAGVDAVGGAPPPMDPAEIQAYWRSKLTGGAARMFDLLTADPGRGWQRDALAEEAHVSPTGGSFGTYLSRLKSNELAVETDGLLYAHPNLFGVS